MKRQYREDDHPQGLSAVAVPDQFHHQPDAHPQRLERRSRVEPAGVGMTPA